jgi:competence protein ComEA
MADEPASRVWSPDRGRVPGLVVLCALLSAGLAWTAAARFSRPVLRTASEMAGEREAFAAGWPELRVDLNCADAAELTLLPGIGPGLAERIVADRAAHGPFEDVDDLMRVKRIGPAVLDRLRPYATVGEATKGQRR